MPNYAALFTLQPVWMEDVLNEGQKKKIKTKCRHEFRTQIRSHKMLLFNEPDSTQPWLLPSRKWKAY